MDKRKALMKSFERQSNFIRDQLVVGNYGNAIQSMELLTTYFKVKVSELGKEGE